MAFESTSPLVRKILADRDLRAPGAAEAAQALRPESLTQDVVSNFQRTSSGLDVFEAPTQNRAFQQIEQLGREVAKIRPPSRREGVNFSTPSGFRRFEVQGTGQSPVLGQFRISQGPGAGHSTGPGGRAWDYAVPIGTKAQAVVDGVVVKVQDLGNRSYGRYIQIRGSDGKTYIYAHLSAFGVRPGQQIARGAIIGATGNSGRSSGPHLHFEVRG